MSRLFIQTSTVAAFAPPGLLHCQLGAFGEYVFWFQTTKAFFHIHHRLQRGMMAKKQTYTYPFINTFSTSFKGVNRPFNINRLLHQLNIQANFSFVSFCKFYKKLGCKVNDNRLFHTKLDTLFSCTLTATVMRIITFWVLLSKCCPLLLLLLAAMITLKSPK